MEIEIKTQIVGNGTGLALPRYHTTGSAGMDLRAAIYDSIVLKPYDRYLIPTGLVMFIPYGFEGQLRPRSGLAFKHGVTLLNSPGTIDSDYRGEIKVLLINLGHQRFEITRGMRIAQLVISPVMQAQLCQTDKIQITLHDVQRHGGFGSTGV
tara:strand:- start:10178 stop:10633 length:456 start_codon:yes stop_codon:yes gene_type:complete